MSGEPLARCLDLTLRPDPERTVLRPFEFATAGDRNGRQDGRLNRILAQVSGTSDDDLERALSVTMARLHERHRDPEAVLRRNAQAAAALVPFSVAHHCIVPTIGI